MKNGIHIAAELGAGIIKTNYKSEIDIFKEVVRGRPVLVVIAAGPRMDSEREPLQMVRELKGAGGHRV